MLKAGQKSCFHYPLNSEDERFLFRFLLTPFLNCDRVYRCENWLLLDSLFIEYCNWEVRLMRVGITLACTECKRRNYSTKKNKKNNPDRVELKKYCPFCKTHTLHKETK